MLAAVKIEGLVKFVETVIELFRTFVELVVIFFKLIKLVGIVIEDVRIFVGLVVALNVMLGVIALNIKFEKLDSALDDCESVGVGVGVD